MKNDKKLGSAFSEDLMMKLGKNEFAFEFGSDENFRKQRLKSKVRKKKVVLRDKHVMNSRMVGNGLQYASNE